MPVFIHIGYHKTGTTAIQQVLSRNRQMLFENKIVYPEGMSSWPGHPELAWVFASEPWPWQDQEYDADTVRAYYRSLMQNAIATRQTLILSSEEINRMEFDLVAFNAFCQFIAPFNPTIIGYHRDPLAFLLSRYRHEIQNGSEIRTLREFLCSFDNLQTAAFFYRAMKWRQSFPSNSVFRSYEATREVYGSVVPDFLEAIGCTLPMSDLSEEYTERKIHPALLEARRLVNRGALSEDEHGRLAEQIFDLGSQLPGSDDTALDVELSADIALVLHTLRESAAML